MKLPKFTLDSSGSEIAEFAIVVPVLFAFIFAIFSFGRAYNIYSTITRAAEEGARVAATPACASCTAGTPPCKWAPFPCDDAVTNAVLAVMNISRIDPSQISVLIPSTSEQSCVPPAPASSTCTGSNNITVCRNVVLNPNSGSTSDPPECGTIVSFSYPYRLVPILGLQPINIPARAQVRMEY